MGIASKQKGVIEMAKKVNKLIWFPAELVKGIEKYQEENYIEHFTQAVITLIKKALESEGITKK